MLTPQNNQTDSFSQDLEALFNLPPSPETNEMSPLILISAPDSLTDSFDPDLSAEHTADHRNCPACMAADSALQGVKVNFAKLQFTNIDENGIDRGAAGVWMRLRRQSMSLHARTHEATQGYLDALAKFLGALRLCDITPGHVRGYQIARLHNFVRQGGKDLHPWQHCAGHMLINHEISVLGQMLKHCRLWQRIQPFYFPLSVKQWSPRTILTEDEEERLFKIAASHPEAALAYHVAVITNNTGAAGLELRGLRLKHIFLPAEGIAEIYIPEDSVKNNSRPRKLPLNPKARWAVEQIYKRALQLGSCEPDHYLFPFRVLRNRFDPTRQASRSWLRKSWAKLRKATGFQTLEPYQLRHHFATKLLEADVNIETAQALMGHLNPAMTRYYAHQRTRVKYAAVCAIETKKKKPVASQTARQPADGTRG